MDDVRARWLRPDNGSLQTPVAQLVCNFAEGVDGKPPLLTHDDVITLFHEFGHGLHHMLTQVNERDVSGISGVEWDAVELPSQFMENFCWEWDVLRHMTAHVDTGEPLPRALFDKMTRRQELPERAADPAPDRVLAVRHAAAHRARRRAAQPGDVMALLGAGARRSRGDAGRRPSAARPTPSRHIFSGGYAAGYYSYKWAEVLSADAYAAFEESAGAKGVPSVETGRRYRAAILEAGGSRPAMESFKAFRGREPQLDALLRHQGMAPEHRRPEWRFRIVAAPWVPQVRCAWHTCRSFARREMEFAMKLNGHIWVIALACVATAAMAQQVYRQVDANGKRDLFGPAARRPHSTAGAPGSGSVTSLPADDADLAL